MRRAGTEDPEDPEDMDDAELGGDSIEMAMTVMEEEDVGEGQPSEDQGLMVLRPDLGEESF